MPVHAFWVSSFGIFSSVLLYIYASQNHSVVGFADGNVLKLGIPVGEKVVVGGLDGKRLGSPTDDGRALGTSEGSPTTLPLLGTDEGNELGIELGSPSATNGDGPPLGNDDGSPPAAPLGMLEGIKLGADDGTALGVCEGSPTAAELGPVDGNSDGTPAAPLGPSDGISEGLSIAPDGLPEGIADGIAVGLLIIIEEGDPEGNAEGRPTDNVDGTCVGKTEGLDGL